MCTRQKKKKGHETSFTHSTTRSLVHSIPLRYTRNKSSPSLFSQKGKTKEESINIGPGLAHATLLRHAPTTTTGKRKKKRLFYCQNKGKPCRPAGCRGPDRAKSKRVRPASTGGHHV